MPLAANSHTYLHKCTLYLSVEFGAVAMIHFVRDKERDHGPCLGVARENGLGDEGLEVVLEATPPLIQEGRV